MAASDLQFNTPATSYTGLLLGSEAGVAIYSAAASPVLTGVDITAQGKSGDVARAVLTLPAITISGTIKAITTASASVHLPSLDLAATGVVIDVAAAELALPQASISATAAVEVWCDSAAVTPAVTVTAVGAVTVVIVATATAPEARVDGFAIVDVAAAAELALPSAQIVAALVADDVAFADIELPVTVEATGLVGDVAAAELTLPVAITATGIVGDVAAAELTLPGVGITATGIAGDVAAAELTLSSVDVVAGGLAGALDVTADAALELQGVAVQAAATTRLVAAAAAVVLDSMTVMAGAVYADAVRVGVSAGVGAAWSVAAVRPTCNRMSYAAGRVTSRTQVVRQGGVARVAKAVSLPIRPVRPLVRDQAVLARVALPASTVQRIVLGVAAARRGELRTGHRPGAMLRLDVTGRHRDMLRLQTGCVAATTEGHSISTGWLTEHGLAQHLPTLSRVVFRAAHRPDSGISVRLADELPIERVGSADLVFRRWSPATPHLVLGEERIADIVVPSREIYIVINDVHLVRADDGTPIDCTSLTLGADVDSWAWSWRASISAKDQDKLVPAAGAPACELLAHVNGGVWRVFVESMQRDREFGKSALTIGGRSVAAVWDDPYAAQQVFKNDMPAQMQQLAIAALATNGVPSDWTIDWQVPDWLVPASIWSHQGTPMSAICRIAEAAGGYVQSAPAGGGLIVRPRYPAAPWAWGGLTPDLELPAAVVRQEGIEWRNKPIYNRVFVSGSGAGGVLGRVTRGGTAGDLIAPMITDSLCTDVQAARARALPVLSDVSKQAMVKLRLPVLAETGVIVPGQLVQYVDGEVTRIGLTRSVDVQAGRPQVWQTIGVQTYE